MNEKKPLKILDSINIGFVISVAVILIITVGIFILLLWGFSELGYINLESMDDFGFFIFLTFDFFTYFKRSKAIIILHTC